MTPWTDERLEALLTQTFAGHKGDVDADVAQHLAATATSAPRPRRTLIVVAAAAAVVLTVVLTAWLLPGTRETQPVPTSRPSPVVAGNNRALARAEAVRVLAAIPVPPGATRVTNSPARTLNQLGVYAQEVDSSLTQTAWYVVPLGHRELVEWYVANSPSNTSSAYPPDSTTPATEGDLYWQPGSASDAFSQPAAVVSYARLGPYRTALRADATLAARFDRTSETLLPVVVDSVEIARSELGNPTDRPSTRRVTDPVIAARIAVRFNDLDGGFAHTQGHACASPVGTPYVHTLTFRWPGHMLVLDVDLRSMLCGDGMRLHLDEFELRPSLAYDDAFDALLDTAYEES